MKIFFVCTGNTCRSPMAESILKYKKIPNVEVRSAGVYATNGAPMSRNAQQVLSTQNIPFSHESKQLIEQDLQWADLILTMTNGHKQAIVQQHPGVLEKTFTLKEFVGATGSLDVADPYGGNVEVYEHTYKELVALIDLLQEQMKEGD